MYYSIRTVFVVFLVVLGVIALSKVSTSSTDYTAIFLLRLIWKWKSKSEANESESRAMCQRGFRDNWQTGKPHRFPFLAEVADCASLDLLLTQTAFGPFCFFVSTLNLYWMADNLVSLKGGTPQSCRVMCSPHHPITLYGAPSPFTIANKSDQNIKKRASINGIKLTNGGSLIKLVMIRGRLS